MDDKENDRDALLAELAKRGVRLKLGGCGCCFSPWFKVEIDGKMIYDHEDATMNNLEADDATQ